MNRNAVLEYSVTGTTGTEPVLLADVKQALNMVFDTAGSYEFTDDDTYITSLISAARTIIENYIGQSIVEKTIVAAVQNDLGGVRLPMHPVKSITAIVDENDTAVSYTTKGVGQKTIESPLLSYLKCTYVAGMTEIPSDLKQAIICQAVYLYQNRGESNLSADAKKYAAPYYNKLWLQ